MTDEMNRVWNYTHRLAVRRAYEELDKYGAKHPVLKSFADYWLTPREEREGESPEMYAVIDKNLLTEQLFKTTDRFTWGDVVRCVMLHPDGTIGITNRLKRGGERYELRLTAMQLALYSASAEELKQKMEETI